jgi:hypothetical protein
MNLPVSNPVVKNAPLDKIIAEKLFLDLFSKKFTGYIYLTIEGKYSFEESIIILNEGKIEGAIYLQDSYDIELLGKDAIYYCFNCFGATNGRLNLFTLTTDQVKLILLFNEKTKFNLAITKTNSIPGLKDVKYNEKIIDNLLRNKIEIPKTSRDVLNDFNLEDLLREEK